MNCYYAELKSAGVTILPPIAGRLLRLLFRPIAIAQTVMAVRNLSRYNAVSK
jgi:hypothetical protein